MNLGNEEKGKMCWGIATFPPSTQYPDKKSLFFFLKSY